MNPTTNESSGKAKPSMNKQDLYDLLHELSRSLEKTTLENGEHEKLSAALIPDLARCGHEKAAIERAYALLDTYDPDKLNIFDATMGRIISIVIHDGRLEEALELITESERAALSVSMDTSMKAVGELRLLRYGKRGDDLSMDVERFIIARKYIKNRAIEKALTVIRQIHDHRYKADCFFEIACGFEEYGDLRSDEYYGKGLLETGLIKWDFSRGYRLKTAAVERAEAGKYDQAVETASLIPSPRWRMKAYADLGSVFAKNKCLGRLIEMYNAVIDVEEFPEDEYSDRNRSVSETLANFAFVSRMNGFDESEIMFKEALHYAMLAREGDDKVLSLCNVSIMMRFCDHPDIGASFDRAMAISEKLDPCDRSSALSSMTTSFAIYRLFEPSLFLLPRVFIRSDYEYALSNVVENLADDRRRTEAVRLWKDITYYKEKRESLEKIVAATLRAGEVAEAMNMMHGNENEKYKQVILKGIIENLHWLEVS